MQRIKHFLFLLFLLLPIYCGAQNANSNDTASIGHMLDRAEKLKSSQHDSALILLETALEQSCNMGYEKRALQAAYLLSNWYLANNMIDRYQQQYEKALQISKKKKLNQLLPNLYFSLGYINLVKGLNAEAMDYYYKAVQGAEKNAHPTTLAALYVNISSNWPDYWPMETALMYLDKAETISRPYNFKEMTANININRGYLWMRKDARKAITYYKVALSIAREHGLTNTEYLALTNIGGALSSLDKNAEGLQYLKAAQTLKGTISLNYQLLSLNIIGNIYKRLKDYKQAETYLLKALKLAEDNKVNAYLVDNQGLLAELYASQGNFEKAYDYQRSYSTLKDSLQNERMQLNLNQLEVKYRTAQKDKENALNQLKIKEQEAYLRKKNIWIGGISAGALFLSILLLTIYRANRHKRNAQDKQIQFLQQEQEALLQQQEVLKREKEIDQLKALIRGEEKERNRLSRELHDGIGGMLSAINMNLNAIQKRHTHVPEMKDLNAISQMLDNTSTSLRNAAHNLMPDVLLRHSLKEALLLYCEQISAHSTLQIDIQCYGNLDLPDKSKLLAIYRIIQELIQNIIKHAQATNAAIQVMEHENKLSITVEDNGIGFNRDVNSSGYGLRNLDYRIKALQGDISVTSRENIGTTVCISFDMEYLTNEENRAV